MLKKQMRKKKKSIKSKKIKLVNNKWIKIKSLNWLLCFSKNRTKTTISRSHSLLKKIHKMMHSN